MNVLAVRLVFTAMLCTLVPAIGHAGAARTHDGFILRLSAGGGAAGTEISDASGRIELSGSAGDVNIAIGGMIQENFAIHATIFGWSISDPEADIFISGVGSGSGSIDGTATMSAVGPGVTYYVMPLNLYLSGSIGFGTLELDSDDVDGETDSGMALDLTVGKEWWVGDSWGLGLAGGFTYHSLPDKDIDESWSGASFALRFSATFN